MGIAERAVARVFSDVRDFPIYVSHIDDNTRLWFSPWRIWDGAAAIIFGGTTGILVYNRLDEGGTVPIALFGTCLTILAVVLARQVPISRPSPMYRLLWWVQCVVGTRSDGGKQLAAPEAIDGNIVFTKGGVYGVYVLAGAASSALAPTRLVKRIAQWHRRLVQNMPTPMVFTGKVAPLHPKAIMQRMLGPYADRPGWEQEVRDWEPYLNIEPMYETVYMLRIPLDGGLQGRTSTGMLRRAWRVLLGVDEEDSKSLAGYRKLSAQIQAKIPKQLRPRPATPSQIQWWRYRELTSGAADIAFPPDGFGPTRMQKADLFPEVEFDLGDQKGAYERRVKSMPWMPKFILRLIPSFAPMLRVQAKGFPSSYQALLPVAELPRIGMAFPGSDFLKAIEDIEFDGDEDEAPPTYDWNQYVQTRPSERALNTVDSAERNLKDQYVQRAGHKSGDDDLIERIVSARDYNKLLRANKLERECETTTVLTVGASSSRTVHAAVQKLHDTFAEMEIALALPKGAQRDLRKIGNPGGEAGAPTDQFGHPTTTKNWGMFGSLVTTTLGNDTGMLAGINQSSKRPAPVLIDPEGAPERRHPMGFIVYGPPGGGKSMFVKRAVRSGLLKGTRFSIDDPGSKMEWRKAFGEWPGAIVQDLTKPTVTFDTLRVFPRESAVEHFLDHMVPTLGLDPQGRPVRQVRQLLRPDARVAETTPGLLRYLKSLRGEDAERYEELTDALDAASTIDYLRAMFDESLPDWDLQNAPVVIWLTHAIELPDEANTNEHHLYQRQTPRARAGMALYGLMSTMTREMYSTSPEPAIAVREESRIFHRSPAGQRESTRIITQGRKETMGLYAIDQDFETFSHIKEQYLPTRIITPYEHEEETRKMLAHNGIDPDEYPALLEMEVVDGHGYALFIDEFRRAGLIDMLPPAQQELVDLWDTSTRRERLREDAWA